MEIINENIRPLGTAFGGTSHSRALAISGEEQSRLWRNKAILRFLEGSFRSVREPD
jgi:predicted oxidoreductase (fatty acid repression mutant protein)